MFSFVFTASGHDVPLPSARLAARLVARPDTGAEQHPGAGRIPAEAAKALHLLDYIGADYPPTVHDGKVMDAGEYREQQEFSAVLAEVLKALPDNPERNGLEQGVQALRQAIDQRQEGAVVAKQARQLGARLAVAYEVSQAPIITPIRPVAPRCTHRTAPSATVIPVPAMARRAWGWSRRRPTCAVSRASTS